MSCITTEPVLGATAPVLLDSIVDEHTVEVTVEEDRCEYAEAKNLVYKECDHEMWKFYSCDWFVKGWQNRVVKYNSMRELLEANKGYRAWNGQHHRDTAQHQPPQRVLPVQRPANLLRVPHSRHGPLLGQLRVVAQVQQGADVVLDMGV